MRGREIVSIAEAFEWRDAGPGGSHPFILKKAGARRPVPVRDKLENRSEVQGLLKQLGIPRDHWPEKVR